MTSQNQTAQHQTAGHQTAGEAVRNVLMTPEPAAKVMAARAATRQWRKGALAADFTALMPDVPARPARPELLRPGQMPRRGKGTSLRSEEHTSELQSRPHLVCRLLLEKKK